MTVRVRVTVLVTVRVTATVTVIETVSVRNSHSNSNSDKSGDMSSERDEAIKQAMALINSWQGYLPGEIWTQVSQSHARMNDMTTTWSWSLMTGVQRFRPCPCV